MFGQEAMFNSVSGGTPLVVSSHHHHHREAVHFTHIYPIP